MPQPIIIEDWKPVGRNSLRGFCTVNLPSETRDRFSEQVIDAVRREHPEVFS